MLIRCAEIHCNYPDKNVILLVHHWWMWSIGSDSMCAMVSACFKLYFHFPQQKTVFPFAAA